MATRGKQRSGHPRRDPAALGVLASLLLVGCVAPPEVAGLGGSVLGELATPQPSPTASPSPLAQHDDPAPPSTDVVLDARGRRDHRSKPFTVDDSWSITWRHGGRGLFSVQVIPADVDTFGELLVSAVGPRDGHQPMYTGGTFRLRITATGTWQVTIHDLERAPSVTLPEVIVGSGPSSTPGFVADGPWVVEWVLDEAAPLGLELYRLDGGEPVLLVDERDVRVGCRLVSDRGAVFVHVVTTAGWELRLQPADGELVCPVSPG